MFGVSKISFKASYNDSMGKDNTENKIFPLSQIFQENVSVVTKLTQLTVTPEKNYDAWLYIAYRNKIK